jgi:hypothetical protein
LFFIFIELTFPPGDAGRKYRKIEKKGKKIIVDGYTYRAEGAAHQDQEYRVFSKANRLSCLLIILIVL